MNGYLSGAEKAGKLCVPFYFHKRGERGGYIGKRAFYEADKNTDLLPNGRKFYLHHPQSFHAAKLPEWKAAGGYDPKTNKQRLRCTPLSAGQTFFFHIDFENLSRAELCLLERSLAPGPAFLHRLGLGKPLGLGSVTLGVEGLFEIDRGARVAPDVFAKPVARYTRVWRPDQSPQQASRERDFSGRYRQEHDFLRASETLDKPAEYEVPDLIDTDTLAAVCALGDPSRLDPALPVRTPFVSEQERQAEGKSYEWFNRNDKHGRQALPAVPTVGRNRLPHLYADWRDGNKSRSFFNVEVGEVADEPDPSVAVARDVAECLAKALPVAKKKSGARSDNAAIISTSMATIVTKIPDPDLRQRVFGHLKGLWLHGELPLRPLMPRKAVAIYEEAGFDMGNE